MIPLIVFLVASAIARLAGWAGVGYADSAIAAVAIGLAAMFTMTALAHAVPSMRADLIAIVPPQLPAAGFLVTLTGVAEFVGAVSLVFPATRVAAAIGLMLLLLVMFPANIYAASMPNPPDSMTTRLPRRIAAQTVYVAAGAFVAFGAG